MRAYSSDAMLCSNEALIRTTATLQHNTTTLLQAQGDLEPWRSQTWEDLEASRERLGNRHPSTLVSINNVRQIASDGWRPCPRLDCSYSPRYRRFGIGAPQMALLLQAEGDDLEVAAALFREALETRRATLGDRHPDTLVSLNNLARLLQDQGKLEAAELLLHESMEACHATLDPRHRTRLRAYGWLADVCRAQGRYGRAREVLDAGYDAVLNAPCPSRRAVLIAVRAALGPTVDTTLMLEAIDARLRISEGEGLEPLREVLARMRTALGPQSPETQRCERMLAKEEAAAAAAHGAGAVRLQA